MYIKQNIIAVLRKVNSHLVEICILIKVNDVTSKRKTY